MERKLEIIVRSASGLDDVRRTGQMRVYATVSLSSAIATIQRTKVDMIGETNPNWNSNMSFSISHAQYQNHNLVFRLYCERTLLKDKQLGEVHVPLNVLRAEHSNAYTEVSYPVFNLKNNSHGGNLNFSYRFQDNLAGTCGSFYTPPHSQRQNPPYSQQLMVPRAKKRMSKIQLVLLGIRLTTLIVTLGQLGI